VLRPKSQNPVKFGLNEETSPNLMKGALDPAEYIELFGRDHRGERTMCSRQA
jgi:hypothetical protein